MHPAWTILPEIYEVYFVLYKYFGFIIIMNNCWFTVSINFAAVTRSQGTVQWCDSVLIIQKVGWVHFGEKKEAKSHLSCLLNGSEALFGNNYDCYNNLILTKQQH